VVIPFVVIVFFDTLSEITCLGLVEKVKGQGGGVGGLVVARVVAGGGGVAGLDYSGCGGIGGD
jgi:hypothetical protein